MWNRKMMGWMVLVAALAGCGGSDDAIPAPAPVAAPQKIIIDSDYNTMSDDGQLGVMAVQLQAQGLVKVMGISVVSGNQWRDQGVADALKAVERLGASGEIGVYAGPRVLPSSHPLATVQQELIDFPGGDGYLGAWGTELAAPLVAPADGFALYTALQPRNAVDFIVDTVKANPNEVTILAIGPLTNIAAATARNPEIIPLIKKIIYMGGAIDVAGNTTKTAEFNFWFDPRAVQSVLRLPIPQVVVPLDVTDTVLLTKPVYDQVAHPAKPGIVAALFEKAIGHGFSGSHGFEEDPTFTINIWDSLTIAYLVDPSFATETVDDYVDVSTEVGANDGKSFGYATPPAGVALQKMTVVKKFDNARFFAFYVDLLTRPVPVTLAK